MSEKEKAVPDLSSLRVRQTSLVPLERDKDDGTTERVLYWLIGDEVYVHPHRWPEFLLLVNGAP